MSGASLTLHITWSTPSLRSSMVVAPCQDIDSENTGETELLNICLSQRWIGNCGGGSHFNRTMIRSTKLKPHWSGWIRRKKCSWVAQSRSWLELNQTFMATLYCSPSTIPIKLGRTRAIFIWRMGKYFTISLCKAGRDLPRKTHSSHCCKRCFHQVLTLWYFYNQWILICTCFLQPFLTRNPLQL